MAVCTAQWIGEAMALHTRVILSFQRIANFDRETPRRFQLAASRRSTIDGHGQAAPRLGVPHCECPSPRHIRQADVLWYTRVGARRRGAMAVTMVSCLLLVGYT